MSERYISRYRQRRYHGIQLRLNEYETPDEMNQSLEATIMEKI